MLLAPARNDAYCNKYVTYLSQWAQCRCGTRSTMWSTSCLTSWKPLHYRGFKSWWAWVSVGDVVLNFYIMLDEARWKETCLFRACLSYVKRRRTLTKHVSHMGKRRHTLIRSASLLSSPSRASGSWLLHIRQWSGSWSKTWRISCLKSSKHSDYHRFKSWWPWVIIGEVGLNFYTVLDEASWKETRPFGACLTFGSMQDTLLQAHLPCKWNKKCAPSTSVSNTRKRETRVLGAHLTLGPAH
jgi:hypothetical protein